MRSWKPSSDQETSERPNPNNQSRSVGRELTALGRRDKADFLEDSGRRPLYAANAFYFVLSLD